MMHVVNEKKKTCCTKTCMPPQVPFVLSFLLPSLPCNSLKAGFLYLICMIAMGLVHILGCFSGLLQRFAVVTKGFFPLPFVLIVLLAAYVLNVIAEGCSLYIQICVSFIRLLEL